MFLSSNPQSDRRQHRLQFRDAWLKHIGEQTLTPLEKQIVSVIEEHPEYHDQVASLKDEEPVELIDLSLGASVENPFLHMGLHLALREQVGTDRPAGIKLITRQLLTKLAGEGHQVEHMMMDVLAESLWSAQQNNIIPNERDYLESLNRLI